MRTVFVSLAVRIVSCLPFSRLELQNRGVFANSVSLQRFKALRDEKRSYLCRVTWHFSGFLEFLNKTMDLRHFCPLNRGFTSPLEGIFAFVDRFYGFCGYYSLSFGLFGANMATFRGEITLGLNCAGFVPIYAPNREIPFLCSFKLLYYDSKAFLSAFCDFFAFSRRDGGFSLHLWLFNHLFFASSVFSSLKNLFNLKFDLSAAYSYVRALLYDFFWGGFWSVFCSFDKVICFSNYVLTWRRALLLLFCAPFGDLLCFWLLSIVFTRFCVFTSVFHAFLRFFCCFLRLFAFF